MSGDLNSTRAGRWLSCVAAISLAGAALANEPSPPNITISSRLALKGDNFVHLQNREHRPVILEVSPGPLSSLQFAPKRVTLNVGASADVKLGSLDFKPGRQILHIITKLFDSQNAPAGIGPFLLESVTVSGDEIKKSPYGE